MSRRCWTPLGPACVRVDDEGKVAAGSFHAVALDPSDPSGLSVYAGATSGGLWKTANGGVTWEAIGDRLPTLAINAIAVDPTPAGKFLFVGTGERRSVLGPRGLGVLISPDGGQTWDPLPDPNPMHARRVNALAVDPTVFAEDGGHRRIWAATVGGLFVTENRGRSWIQAQPGSWMSLGFSDGRLVGASGDGIFRQDGVDMKRALELPFTSSHTILAVAPSNTKVIYAAAVDTVFQMLRALRRSDDGGDTWKVIERPSGFGSASTDDMSMTVHPAAPNRLYFLHGGLAHTFDGGATEKGWDGVSHGIAGDAFGLAFSRTAPFVAWVAASDGIYVSFTEGTRTPPVPEEGEVLDEDEAPDQRGDWHHRKRGLSTTELSGLAQHPTERSILLGAVRNGPVRYRSHPLWSRLDSTTVFRVAIDPHEPTTWYATTLYRDGSGVKGVLQSKDAGATWKAISMGLKPEDLGSILDFTDICPLAVDPSQKGIVYFGTENLYRWDDAHPEAGWVLLSGTADDQANLKASPITAIAVAPSDPSVIYVGTRDGSMLRIGNLGGIFKILARVTGLTSLENFPAPFTILNGTTGFGGPISSIAVAADDPESLFVTTRFPLDVENPADKKNPHRMWVFHSRTGARTWSFSPLSLLPTLPDLDSIPPGDLVVHKILLEPDAPFRLFLATDRGVLVSLPDQFVPRFRDFSDNLPRASVTDLALFPPGPRDPAAQPPTPRVLRAASFGRGVWERVLDEPAGACEGIDIFVRDDLLDTGEAPTPDGVRPDPGDPGDTLAPTDARDLKVDRPSSKGKFLRPASNVRYLPSDDPAAVADFIGFEVFKRDWPQAGVDAHVYLQVHNRGPSVARVRARVLFARGDLANLNPLPDDPLGAIPPTHGWQPVGDTQEVDVRPGEPTVVRWVDWRVPRDLTPRTTLVGVISAQDDALPFPRTDHTLELALADKHLLIRQMEVVAPPARDRGFFRWWMIPAGIGLAYLVVDALDIEPLDALDVL